MAYLERIWSWGKHNNICIQTRGDLYTFFDWMIRTYLDTSRHKEEKDNGAVRTVYVGSPLVADRYWDDNDVFIVLFHWPAHATLMSITSDLYIPGKGKVAVCCSSLGWRRRRWRRSSNRRRSLRRRCLGQLKCSLSSPRYDQYRPNDWWICCWHQKFFSIF